MKFDSGDFWKFGSINLHVNHASHVMIPQEGYIVLLINILINIAWYEEQGPILELCRPKNGDGKL